MKVDSRQREVKLKIRKEKSFGLYSLRHALCALCSVEAQQPKKMARIGYLSAQSGPPPTLVAFKEGLRELGWVEGKRSNLSIATPGARLISLLSLRLNLFALKLTSSSRGLVTGRLLQPSVRLQRFLL